MGMTMGAIMAGVGAALLAASAPAMARPGALSPETAAMIDAATAATRAASASATVTRGVARYDAPAAGIDRSQSRVAASTMAEAVIAAIARDPTQVEAVIATAVARAPAQRRAIVDRASAAFPGFAARIARAATLPPPPPSPPSLPSPSLLTAPPPATPTPSPKVSAAPAPVAASPLTPAETRREPSAPTPRPGLALTDAERRLRVAIGVGTKLRPDFVGADTYELVAVPVVDVDWGGLAFINMVDGMGVNVVHTRSLRVALALTFNEGRAESDAPRLRGLGDVDAAVEFGGFIEYGFLDTWFLRGGLRQDIFGGHQGAIADAIVGYRRRWGSALDLEIRTGATWGDDTYMAAFFGIDAAQASGSGRKTFSAGADFKDVWFDATAVYDLSARWFLRGVGRLGLLIGNAADSPISDEDFQASAEFGLGYRF